MYFSTFTSVKQVVLWDLYEKKICLQFTIPLEWINIWWCFVYLSFQGWGQSESMSKVEFYDNNG